MDAVEKWVSMEEICAHLNASRDTVKKMIRTQKYAAKSLHTSTKKWLILRGNWDLTAICRSGPRQPSGSHPIFKQNKRANHSRMRWIRSFSVQLSRQISPRRRRITSIMAYAVVSLRIFARSFLPLK